MLRIVIIFIFVLLAAACGEEASETETQASLDGLSARLAAAQCDKIFRCCTEEDLDTVFSGVTVETREQCVELVDGNVRVFLVPALEEAAQSGAVTVESSAESGCIEALEMQSCNGFNPSPNIDLFALPECRAFIAPALETSEFCNDDFECKSGFCARRAGEEQGSCTTPPAADEACSNERCAEGLYCLLTESICRPALSIGEACTRNNECLSDNCLERMDGSRTCGEPPMVCME